MRIAVFPGYDERAASSRLRAFTLQRSLAALGHDARLNDLTGAEAVVIQKRISPKRLDAILRTIGERAKLIYDVDDAGEPLWHAIAPSVLRRILMRADVVTTDTEGHREMLLRDYAAPAVAIVPDPIDYDPVAPVRPAPASDSRMRILWFGSMWNIALFEKHVTALRAIEGAEIVAVTNASAIERLRGRLPDVTFIPWSRDTFVSVLRNCTISVLPHDGTANDRAKSNNRMITSITWGVPAIVSRTPEYERTARDAGVDWAAFSDEGELVAAVSRLRDETARFAYLDGAQPEVWRRYRAEAVAQRFLEVVADATRGPAAPPGYWQWLRRAARGHLGIALASEAGHRLLRR